MTTMKITICKVTEISKAQAVFLTRCSAIWKNSRYENALDLIEIEDGVYQRKAETVYRELLIRRIIDALKVGTEEYKERHKP